MSNGLETTSAELEKKQLLRKRRRQKRIRAEKRLRRLGLAAIGFAMLVLALLFGSVVIDGHGAFTQRGWRLDLHLDPELLDPEGQGTRESMAHGDFAAVVKRGLRARFPEVESRRAKRELTRLVSVGAAFKVRQQVLDDPSTLGKIQSFFLPLSADSQLYLRGFISSDTPERNRRLSDQQIGWLDALSQDGVIESKFNWAFFTSGDSREPELAGVGGALVGTVMTLVVTFLLSFPLGVATAVYLEEFAPRSRWTDFVEININNLAAVPSVIFGVLGLAIFLDLFGFPRSTPLVGGLVLALRTLPIIIIASRAALAAVPPSIREAAMGVGASPLQVVLHHVLPVGLPGILTGTIIGMAQALGETAPLLMIGMVAFIADVPSGFEDPSTVLPVQIFLWSDAPERAFQEKTAGAILVLLTFLLSMNGLAVWLRHHVQKSL